MGAPMYSPPYPTIAETYRLAANYDLDKIEPEIRDVINTCARGLLQQTSYPEAAAHLAATKFIMLGLIANHPQKYGIKPHKREGKMGKAMDELAASMMKNPLLSSSVFSTSVMALWSITVAVTSLLLSSVAKSFYQLGSTLP